MPCFGDLTGRNRPTTCSAPAWRTSVQGDRWVIDGNYSRVQSIIWDRVDTVVWMDYPFRTVLWQLFWRTLRRVISREELWAGTGNTETWGNSFASKDSLFVWLVTSYWRRRKRYARVVESPENSHIDFVRLTSRSADQKMAERFGTAKRAGPW